REALNRACRIFSWGCSMQWEERLFWLARGSFQARADAWTQERIDGKTANVRTLRDVDLFDVGPCTYPAYSDTKVSARSSGIVTPETTGLYVRRNPDVMNGRDSGVMTMTAEEMRLRLRMASSNL